MKRYLLDTCTFLWMLTDEALLGSKARGWICDPTARLHLSAASSWEIAIKCAIGKLQLDDPPDLLVPAQMERNAIAGLPVDHRHALGTLRLPHHHADPFDRLLVAQAQLERLVILTPDAAIRAYDVETLW